MAVVAWPLACCYLRCGGAFAPQALSVGLSRPPPAAAWLLQERGACPKQHEPKCMFVWLHWRAELVLNHHQLAGKLAEALAMLRAAGTLPDSGGCSQGGGAAATA